MPSPKDGKAGTLVPPAAPVQATDADNAQPGEVETIKAQQRETRTGKYGSEPVTPYVKPAPSNASTPPEKKSWIEIHLLDTEGEPVAGEPYEVTLPDHSVATGTTDANGKGRVDGFSPGECKVTFPNLDKTVVNPQ